MLCSLQRRLELHVPRRFQLDVEMLNFRISWSRVRVWCWRPNDGRTDCNFNLQNREENEIRHFYCQGLGQWTVPDNNYRVFFLITLSPELQLGACASFSFCLEGLQNEIGAHWAARAHLLWLVSIEWPSCFAGPLEISYAFSSL